MSWTQLGGGGGGAYVGTRMAHPLIGGGEGERSLSPATLNIQHTVSTLSLNPDSFPQISSALPSLFSNFVYMAPVSVYTPPASTSCSEQQLPLSLSLYAMMLGAGEFHLGKSTQSIRISFGALVNDWIIFEGNKNLYSLRLVFQSAETQSVCLVLESIREDDQHRSIGPASFQRLVRAHIDT